jgi:hypothetical protein
LGRSGSLGKGIGAGAGGSMSGSLGNLGYSGTCSGVLGCGTGTAAPSVPVALSGTASAVSILAKTAWGFSPLATARTTLSASFTPSFCSAFVARTKSAGIPIIGTALNKANFAADVSPFINPVIAS